MNENDSPQEGDLKQRLAHWRAPAASPALDDRVLEMHRSGRWKSAGWRRLLTGTVRVPIPLAAAVCVLLLLAVVAVGRPARVSPVPSESNVRVPVRPVPDEVSLPRAAAEAHFAPAPEMKVTILYRGESR
jgi:hypothetical protein